MENGQLEVHRGGKDIVPYRHMVPRIIDITNRAVMIAVVFNSSYLFCDFENESRSDWEETEGVSLSKC